MNPAISFGLQLVDFGTKDPSSWPSWYFLAEIFGAFIAAGSLRVVRPDELKDLSGLVTAEFLQVKERLEQLERADEQIFKEMLDLRSSGNALKEVLDGTAANIAVVSASQKDLEGKQSSIAVQQKSDALALSGRLKEMEADWRGGLGFWCKRRQPTPLDFKPSSAKLAPQTIPPKSPSADARAGSSQDSRDCENAD